MPSQTFAVAGTAETLAGVDVDWTDPNNAKTANDTYATVALDNGVGGPESDYLALYNFGFSIPTNATVDGVEVTWFRKCDGGEIRDFNVLLYGDSGTQGDDKGVADFWPTSEGSAVYGGPADTWGLTLNPASINTTNFGCVISAEFVGALTDTAYVDNASITVTYTEYVPATFPQTQPVLKTRRQTRVVSF